jgi:hypothetical protein
MSSQYWQKVLLMSCEFGISEFLSSENHDLSSLRFLKGLFVCPYKEVSDNCGFLHNLTWAGTSNLLKMMSSKQPGRKERQERNFFS